MEERFICNIHNDRLGSSVNLKCGLIGLRYCLFRQVKSGALIALSRFCWIVKQLGVGHETEDILLRCGFKMPWRDVYLPRDLNSKRQCVVWREKACEG